MFHDLTIRTVRQETAEAVAISFDAADGFDWRPGQYLTLRAMVDGVDLRRSYSIASLPGEALTVGVKQVPDGAFSTFAQALEAGAKIAVMAPEGRFVWKGEQNIVLVAAGSGVTPMISIAGAALASGATVTLVYGNRSTATIMFRAALDMLKDRYMERFTLIHVLSRETQDVALLNGRVTGEKIARLAQSGAVDLDGAEAVFLCGPGEMIDNVIN